MSSDDDSTNEEEAKIALSTSDRPEDTCEEEGALEKELTGDEPLLRTLIRQQDEMIRLQKEEMNLLREGVHLKSHSKNRFRDEEFRDDFGNLLDSIENESSAWRYDLGGNRRDEKMRQASEIDEEAFHLLKEKVELLETVISDIKQGAGRNSQTGPARHSIFSTFNELSISTSDGNGNKKVLTNDTFTLMMISRVLSPAWVLGSFSFILEMTFASMIIYEYLSGNRASLFDVPFTVDAEVYVVQFLTIVISLAMQGDILTSVRSFLILGGDSNWDSVIGEEGNRSRCLWFVRVGIPNILKLFQGITVTCLSFVIIVQSSRIIVLLRSFTSLMFISEMDNILFQLASFGYLGKGLRLQTLRIEEAETPKTLPGCKKSWNRGVIVVRLAFIAVLFAYLGGWGAIVNAQKKGKYFDENYPGCGIENYKLALEHFGDGVCFGGPLNTVECKFEDGDCANFNMAYPDCKGKDIELLLNVQNEVGNGICTKAFNVTECDHDGGDCL